MPDRDRSYFPFNSSNSGSSKDSSYSGSSCSAFPVFPPDFHPDTMFLQQALSEHNYERVSRGLPTRDYFHLSDEERHAILSRAEQIKSVNRRKVIHLAEKRDRGMKDQKLPKLDSGQHSEIEEAREFFGSVGFYLLLIGAMGLGVLLWRIL